MTPTTGTMATDTFVSGTLYKKGGSITVNGSECTITNINYSVDGDVVTDASDTKVTIVYANGETESGTPGNTYKIGDSGTGSNSSTTIASVRVEKDGQPTNYPISVSSTAGTSVAVTYKGDSASTSVRYGSYSIGQEVVQKVNVDGENVISAILGLSDGTTQKVTSGFYELGHSLPVTTIVTIYDSEGKSHEVTLLMDKDNVTETSNTTGDIENRWRVYIAPGVGEAGPSSTFTQTETDGSTTSGFFNVVTDDTGTPIGGDVSFVYFKNDGSYDATSSQSGSILLQYGNGNGADDTTSSVDFTGLTQYSGNSTAYPTADGNTFGVLQSVSLDTSGVITGTYTNGTRRFEAQLAVAQFINPAGLTKTGTSLYQESNNSGTANIKTVTDLGLTITPSALEMSNVDLASELADMIVTQRGFQSNSKIITVGDEMLETLINMKR